MTKILIAEDERDIRDLVVFTLQFGGFEVVATGNGAELVSAAPNEKPDLILTDVRMPKMTGYEACQALKTNPDTKDIPIVFLSAKGQEEEVGLGMQAGATAYILKPFAPDVLLSKVKEILAEHGLPKPKAAAPAASPAPSAPAPSAPAPSAPAPSTPAPSTPPPAPKPPEPAATSAPAPTPAVTPAPPAPSTPAPTAPAPSTPAPAAPPAQVKPPDPPAPSTPAAPTPPAPASEPPKDTPPKS